MDPKSATERNRESRLSIGDFYNSEQYVQFVRDTPFSSKTTDQEKFQAFLRRLAGNKIQNIKWQNIHVPMYSHFFFFVSVCSMA